MVLTVTEGLGEWAGPGREPVSECAGLWCHVAGIDSDKLEGGGCHLWNGLDLAGPAQSWS